MEHISIRETLFGDGAFTTRDILKGELIGYYTGEVLDEASFNDRYNGFSPAAQSYVYVLRQKPVLVIDARDQSKSSWARFINSSYKQAGRRPNVRWGRHIYDGGARVEIRALSKIKADQELLLDYGPSYPWAAVLDL